MLKIKFNKKTKKKKNKKVITKPKVGKYVFDTELTGRTFIEDLSSENLAAVLGNRKEGFLVDVLWNKPEEAQHWEEYKVEVKGEGCHKFKSLNYQDNKI